MIAIDSAEIAGLTGGSDGVEGAVEGVTIDSRKVSPGDLFTLSDADVASSSGRNSPTCSRLLGPSANRTSSATVARQSRST